MLIPEGHKNDRALLVAGGGMKGSFSGGVLAALSQFCPPEIFQLVLGVSAGSCSAAYYVGFGDDQISRSQAIMDIWTRELDGSKFISYWNPFKGKTILDQEYLIDNLLGEKYRISKDSFESGQKPPLFVVVTNLLQMQAEYIRASSKNWLDLLKAATALPIATRGKWSLDGSQYGDGGIADPIPIVKAIESGYRDITVILNDPLEKLSKPIDKWKAFVAYPKNAKLREFIQRAHHNAYNRAKDLIRHPPKGIKIRVIAPKDHIMSITTTSRKLLNRSVNSGIVEGIKIAKDEFLDFLKKKRVF